MIIQQLGVTSTIIDYNLEPIESCIHNIINSDVKGEFDIISIKNRLSSLYQMYGDNISQCIKKDNIEEFIKNDYYKTMSKLITLKNLNKIIIKQNKTEKG